MKIKLVKCPLCKKSIYWRYMEGMKICMERPLPNSEFSKEHSCWFSKIKRKK